MKQWDAIVSYCSVECETVVFGCSDDELKQSDPQTVKFASFGFVSW